MSKSEPEICSRCKQTKPIVLYLVHPDGKREPLCQDCASTFLESDENWPPENTKKEHK